MAKAKTGVVIPKNGRGKLNTCIKQVSAASKNFRETVHTACVALAIHAYHYGDYSSANDLIAAMGAGVKRNQVVDWIKKYVGLEVTGTRFSGWKGKAYIEDHFESGKANPWYKREQDRLERQAENGEGDVEAFTPFDLDRAINAVLDRGEAREKDAKERKMTKQELEGKLTFGLTPKTLERLIAKAQFADEVIEIEAEGKVIHLEQARKEKAAKAKKAKEKPKAVANGGEVTH